MNWPWRTVAREREKMLAQRFADVLRQVTDERERSKYWRERYERLADLMLVRQVNPNAVAAVHVESRADSVVSLGARVGKVAGVLGSARGIPFETIHHASAAEVQE